jgi:hypothetical protein
MQPAAILDGVHKIEKFDRMARRHYGLSDGQGATGNLSITILAGQAAVTLSNS